MHLRKYLELHNMSQFQFAIMIGVTTSAVHWWISGKKKPSQKRQQLIFRKTKGQITLEDWKNVDKKEEK